MVKKHGYDDGKKYDSKVTVDFLLLTVSQKIDNCYILGSELFRHDDQAKLE